MLPYFIAVAAALTVYGAFQGLIAVLYQLPILLPHAYSLHFTRMTYIIDLFVALSNWSACLCAVLVGVNLSPRLREKNRTFMAALLALVVGAMQLAALFVVYRFGEVIGGQTMLLAVIYYGGLLATGAVACYLYERTSAVALLERRQSLAELSGPSPYHQALARLDRRPESIAFKQVDGGIEDTVITTPMERLPNLSLDETLTFIDSDLILLEDELLKIRPDKEAYISAMRLGLAIEKDQNYANCRARNFTFSQLMKDLSMRLAVSSALSEEWSDLAQDLTMYSTVSVEQRHIIVRDMEMLLHEMIAEDLQKARKPVLVGV